MDNWGTNAFLHHRVRNLIRRGYLLKSYYDKKILQGRVHTGANIENDKLDILNPVGFIGRPASGEKVEAFTADVGADPSRRVILAVIGDREHHPKVEEGESIIYSPGDVKKHVRVRTGSEGGIKIEGDDTPISANTGKSLTVKAKENISQSAGGNFSLAAGATAAMAEALADTMAGAGNLIMTALGTMAQSSQGPMAITAKGPLAIASAVAVGISSPQGVSMGSGGGGGIGVGSDGNTEAKGDLAVSGNLTVSGDLVVNGSLTVQGSVRVNGAADFGDRVTSAKEMFARAFNVVP